MKQELEVLTLREKTKWKDLVHRSLYRDIHQLPEYLEPYEEHICAKAHLAKFIGEDCEILFPFFSRKIHDPCANDDNPCGYDIISPWYYGGPIYTGQIDDTSMVSFKDALINYCNENSIVTMFSRFNPYLGNHNKTIGNLNIRKINNVVWVDLSNSYEKIWNRSLSKECRRKVRFYKKIGIEVRMSNDLKDLRSFHNLYTKEMDLKLADKFYMFPLEFLEKLKNNLGEELVISISEFKGNIVAASLWIYKYNIMYALLGSRNMDFPKENSSTPEIWETIKYAKDIGLKVLDLGGGMVDNPGLMEYKRSFSRNLLSLYGQNTIVDFDRYKSICDQHGISSHQLQYENSKYFPEYRYFKSS